MADSDSAARLARIPASLRRVHLIGVGGTAMAALAGMLVERGLSVTGSDNQLYEPTASLLKNSRVGLMTGFSPANLSPAPDLVVVGNVIVPTNPEAVALLASPIPYLSMPEALWHFFLKDRRVLMVAGTHGKTTSTAMMAHVLEAAGRDPSMLVGGVASDFGSNYRLGQRRRFRDRRRRVRHRVFRQRTEVSALPRERRDHHGGRIRSRRYLSRSRACEIEFSRARRADGFVARARGMRRLSARARGQRGGALAAAHVRTARGRISRDGHYGGRGRRAIFGDARRRSNPGFNPSSDRRPNECRQRARRFRAAERVRSLRRRDCRRVAHLQGRRAPAAGDRRGGGSDGGR